MALLRGLFFHSLLSCCALSVTVIPLTLNLPRPYESAIKPATSPYDMVSLVKPDMAPQSSMLFLSSYYGRRENSSSFASKDSFIRGAIEAGAKHQHLAFRAGDVWLTILSQMNFYLRKHGQSKEVVDKFDNLRPSGVSGHSEWIFASMNQGMEVEMKRRRRTDWLRDWIHPNFGTSFLSSLVESVDGIVSAALMMSSSTRSVDEIEPFPCANGIPSITLLGEQKDWETLLLKLTKLKEFGTQPADYSNNLRPILSRFVQTFRDSDRLDIRRFWSDIVTVMPKQGHCNTTRVVTGWINGFHHWDQGGNLLSRDEAAAGDERVSLDGIAYPWRYVQDLPTAYNTFPMCIFGDKGSAKSELLAGMLGKSIRKEAPDDYATAMRKASFTLPATVSSADHSILQPLPFYSLHIDRRFPDPACENENPQTWASRPEGYMIPQDW